MSRSLYLPLILFLAACGGGGGSNSPTVLAVAGDDQEVLLGEAASLDGQASTGVSSARWSLTTSPDGSAASLSGATSLTPSITPDVVGDYVIQLSVNGGESTDSVTLTAKSVIAAISVGTGSTTGTRTRFGISENVINLEESGGVLSAEASQGTVASYSWEQVSGPGATAVGGTTGATFQFTAPALEEFLSESDHYKWQVLPVSKEDTEMIFKLTVSDSSGNTDTETVLVFIQDDGLEIHPSSGLPNVGVGTTVYLSGPDLNAATANTTTALEGGSVTDWSWTLTPPSGSSSVFIDSDSTTSTSQFPRFIPDVAGVYAVAHSSTTGNASSTNPTIKASGTLNIHAAEWVGVGTIGGTSPENPQCATCHDGSIEEDKVTGWGTTKHATIFADSITSYDSLAPEPYLWPSHTVGHNADAANNGFDDLALDEGFTFPDTGLTYDEFTGAYSEVAKLANVQCENCHGPGSQHAGDPIRIAISASQAGVCGQCHQQEAQWSNSRHNMTGVSHGSGSYQSSWVTSAGCIRCHNTPGFVSYLENGEDELATIAAAFETGDFTGVSCAGCHDPHDATNEKQLRLFGEVEMLADGSTVDAGSAAVCYTCHDGFYQHGETNCDADNNRATSNSVECTTIDQAATQNLRQVHYNPQAPVLEGKGALDDLNGDGTADFTLDENSFHSDSSFTLADVTGDDTLSSENNKCVTCHMATSPSPGEEGYGHLGGHAFKLRVGHGIGHLLGDETEEEAALEEEDLELVSACQTCHPSVTEFNRLARADYDGDGTQEGIQDEIKGLLVALTTKIKAQDTVRVRSTSGSTSSGGTVTIDVLSYTGATTNAQTDNFNATSATIRRAIWNHNLIVRDGSLGVHNAAYTIQVLQGTYTAVGGNSFATDYPNATRR